MRNTAIDFLNVTVQKYPDKLCLIDSQQTLSFIELFTWASSIAYILQRDNKINEPVAVYLPKGVFAIVSFVGILMSGNFYVPIDLKSPQKRLQAILEDLAPYRLISSREYQADLQDLPVSKEKVLFLEDVPCKNNSYSLDELIKNNLKTTDQIIDTDPCYIMYTSGSTGVPKGVVIPHRGVIDYIEWAIPCLKVDENEVIGNQAPLYFDNSTLDIYLSLATGATLHLIPEDLYIFPIKLIEYLERHKITFVFVVPSVLVNIAKLRLLSHGRLPSLKKVVFAGEVMPTKHLAYWQKNLPNRFYVNLYGPTEITVDCAYFIVDRIYESHENLPIGFPCRNSGIIILNEKDALTRANEQGELCVRGSSLALGYWKDNEKTKQAFVQNPLQKNYFDRIYRTGDIVYKNERRELIFVGRKDSQIKHMGYRIELGEIENAVMTMSEIDNCCAIYNKEKEEVTLFYEGKEKINEREFCKHMSYFIPNYMIPRKYYFLELLPKNSNGKIDRKALQNEFYK